MMEKNDPKRVAGIFGFWLKMLSCPEIGHKLLEMTQGSAGESCTVSYQDFSAKIHDGKK
jgi:hypothetical protein